MFDVILSYPDKPLLLDFGPLNAKTNLYAFSWKEISPLLNEVNFSAYILYFYEALLLAAFLQDVVEVLPPVFRYVEKDIGIMSRTDALAKFRQAQAS